MKSLLSIVIPVYRSSNTIIELASRVDLTLKKINQPYEMIFVDDGSQNKKTDSALEYIQQTYSAKIIILSRNFGQHAATLCGLQQSKGEYVITMDDDLQHAPEDIPKLLQAPLHDITIAKFPNVKQSLKRRFFSKIKSYFDFIIINKPLKLELTSFRLFNRFTVNNMDRIQTSYPFIPAQMLFITRDISNIELQHHVREVGQSNYNFFKLFKLFSNLLINNSVFMLVALARIGLTASLVSIFFALYVIYQHFFNSSIIAGWTSTIVVISFLGGLNLFGLGIIGEYLLRIVKSTERTPCFIIRDIIENE
ncbi:glycosyltransferase family 2 protein [Pseudoalteromonas sp. C2R02]|uniref:glycosyltransferase family 2 protein n=1 Tax=Pseudoalteromonas sp. C2R02 TaxID=2841565 RepID=UPI001C085FBA|nr:glycosyltransferase family 2 protein [Pseudoalteromonas sp. C2R02]MBU2971729.1 glycosyltransferase family 2 protein [Pseudoalteromonas sp. C2R02]